MGPQRKATAREGSREKEKGENIAKWSKTKSRGISGGNHRRKRAERENSLQEATERRQR